MTLMGPTWSNVRHALVREARKGDSASGRGFPHFTDGGRWQRRPAADLSSWRGEVYEHGNWTLGFWYGVMWLSSVLGGTDTGAVAARARSANSNREPPTTRRTTWGSCSGPVSSWETGLDS